LQDSLVFNVPARHADNYRGRNLIVRSNSAAEIKDHLDGADLTRVRFIQMLPTPDDLSELESWGVAIPIDLVLKDPAADFARLYDYVNLLDNHPVRVSLPVVPGFSKAVKAAVSLGFAVKLNLAQPDGFLTEELLEVLHLYLHRANVRQPIDPFHRMLLSFYHDQPVSMWELAEEDPDQLRYVTDDGEETISPRFAGAGIGSALGEFIERLGQEMLSEKRECLDCAFFNRCGGYFKWPDRTYDCQGVKTLFGEMKGAAGELKSDLNSFTASGGGTRP
jgi:hypothetical protein